MWIVLLFWAGVQIEFDKAAIAINPLEDSGLLCPMLGDPSLPPVFVRQSLNAMLVSHSHPDDEHPDALQQSGGIAGFHAS
jgi:hypothetical protein